MQPHRRPTVSTGCARPDAPTKHWKNKGAVRLDRAFIIWTAEPGLLGRCVKFADLRPVHDVPKGLQVIRPFVLVFEVVGMFPNIDAENGSALTPGDGFAH